MRRSTSLRLAASAAALSVIVGAGAYGTYSAFTDTTDNTGNTFAAGTIDITDDDAGTAMFTLTGMLPGQPATTRCINVSNVGTSPFANVALSGAVGGTGLATSLTVVVDRGTGATGGAAFNCAGFTVVTPNIVTGALSAFPTTASPVNDATGWAPAAVKSYRFTVTLPSTAPQAAQGLNATLAVTWTASS
jgi:predicted ribosomally synthesized peptide with SipW-like signal peptide